MDWEPVIGLEVHAQLLTKTKLFCSCVNLFGHEPNTNVCETCLGLPGSLPVLNKEAVEMAIRIGQELHFEIDSSLRWDRKHYSYPDLPKGYQITQQRHPICKNGYLMVQDQKVLISRMHLEEDAGKNLHDPFVSRLDFNRAGTPLVEIVTAPVIRSGQLASDYLKTLRAKLMELGVNDGKMHEGSFRCDANVSIRPRGTEEFGTRVELKNINSFKFVRDAIDFEIQRQASILEDRKLVERETRRYDHKAKQTVSMRGKEQLEDYRYMPEPDLS